MQQKFFLIDCFGLDKFLFDTGVFAEYQENKRIEFFVGLLESNDLLRLHVSYHFLDIKKMVLP